MAIKYKHAKKFVGKAVVCRCHDGRHHIGTVEKVTKEGVWLRPHHHHVGGEANLTDVGHADGVQTNRAENVFFPGAAFLLPFAALAALTPLAAGAAYGAPFYGGYPPYGYGPYPYRRRRRFYPGPYLY